MTTAPRILPAPPLASEPWTPAASPRCAPWLGAGGALWVAYYATQLGVGFATGQAPQPGQGAFDISGLLFCAAIFCLSAGLLVLGAMLRAASRPLALAGSALAAIGALSITGGAMRHLVLHQATGILGGIGVIGVCLSAALLALAARGFLPKYLSSLLLATGLATFPLILLLGIPAEHGVPPYLTDELPFALSGLAWIALGKRLQRLRIRGALR